MTSDFWLGIKNINILLSLQKVPLSRADPLVLGPFDLGKCSFMLSNEKNGETVVLVGSPILGIKYITPTT